MSCVDENAVSCTTVQTVQLIAHKDIAVFKTKIELDSHAETYVIGNPCLVIYDHNRPVNFI